MFGFPPNSSIHSRCSLVPQAQVSFSIIDIFCHAHAHFPRRIVPQQVCFMFLTLPEDARQGVIVNFHTAEPPLQSRVRYWPRNNSDNGLAFSTASCQWFQMNLMREESRYVSWCSISGLTPDTQYSFDAGVFLWYCCSHSHSLLP